MKTVAIPKDTTEIVTSIMQLFQEMTHIKDEVKQCQKSIVDHAEEARESNKHINDTVNNLQFSVTGLKSTVAAMQESIKELMEMSNSIVTIGRFIVTSSKVLSWVIAIAIGVIGIIQYVH